MTHQTHTIAESNNFIVLDKYTKVMDTGDSYQSESDLERALIQDLINQGYEFISVKSPTAMLANGGASQSSIWTAPVTAAWTKPVKSISTISVILRLMMVVWKTSI